jgi:DNA polymerase type B, organellar and viral
MRLPCLARLTGEPRNSLHTAIDIETWGLNAHEDGSSFAIGDAYDERGHRHFNSRERMAEWLVSRDMRGRCVWAHNGGKYDYLSLFGNYLKTHRPIMVGGRLIEFRVEDGEHVIRFRDSLNLFPTALAEIGEALGFPKGETPKKFIDATHEPITDQDWTYLERDTEIVYRAVMGLQEEFREVRATVPSLAMYHFRRKHLPRDYMVRTALDTLSRPAYYGGRVEAYYLGYLKQAPFYYDINSLYPYAMITTDFPDPSQLHRTYGGLPDDEEGVIFGTAHVPKEMDPPPLPYRLPDKLLFPVGTFAGAWAGPEYRAALAAGVTFDIESCISAPPIPTPFRSYVESVYEKKRTTEGFQRELYKLMLNALYGKFGERHSAHSEYAGAYSVERHEALKNEYGPDVAWKPLSLSRADGFYSYADKDDPEGRAPHSVYIWAAYITSQARAINWATQRELIRNGAKVLYTDTDSFMLTDKEAPPEMVGDRLGALKHESKEVTEIWGAKYYVADGTLYLKGVKKGAAPVYGGRDLVSLDTMPSRPTAYRFSSIVGAREAIRRRLPAGSPKVITRSAMTEYGKRKVNTDGTTEPFCL